LFKNRQTLHPSWSESHHPKLLIYHRKEFFR
jgi:hypothetical protein